MDFERIFREKTMTPEEIAGRVCEGDRIFCASKPDALFNALYERYRDFTDVGVYMASVYAGNKLIRPECNGHIGFKSIFMGAVERAAIKNGRYIEYVGGHLSDTGRLVKNSIKPTKVWAQASVMDENGDMYMGYSSYGAMEAIECGAEIYLEINDALPVIYGECNKVNICDVAGVTSIHTEIPDVPEIPSGPEDVKIAGYILDRIENGSTIQVGIGAVANAVCHGLMDKKDLGIHTELFVPAMVDLIEKGAVNNSKKTVLPGKTVMGFSIPEKRTCDFLNRNKDVEMHRITWVNDAATIGRNYKFVSINGCLAVDLWGQVYSEAIGPRMYSGCGGQYDFVRGCKLGGGQSFLAMHSVTKDHQSKITFGQPEGSIVTVLRGDTGSVVTEYGVADLLFKSVPEKAKALIAIAHRYFRDELTYQAKKYGLIY